MLELFFGGELIRVQPLERFFHDRGDRFFLRLGDLDVFISDGALHTETHVLKTILGVDAGLVRLIFFLVLLGFFQHIIDLVFRETPAIILNSDLLALARPLLDRVDVQDTIHGNIKRHLDLRNTTGCRRDAREIERPQEVTVLRHGALALVHFDRHRRLVIAIGREHLGLPGGNGAIARDDGRHHIARRLDTDGERAHVQQKQIFDLLVHGTREHGRLHRRAIRHRLVRVHRLAELLAIEKLGEHRLDLGDTRRPTDENHLIDIGLAHLRIGEHFFDRCDALPIEIRAQLIEASPRQVRREIHAFVEAIEFDRGRRGRRERSLGTFAGVLEAFDGSGVIPDIFPVLSLELVEEMLHQAVIDILATQVGIAARRLHFEHSILDLQNRNIEGTTTKVEHQNVLLFRRLVIETIGDGRRSRLVDDTQDIEPRDGPRIFRGLALLVVEVGWNGDDDVRDFCAQVVLGDLLHLGDDHRRNLLRVELFRLIFVIDLDLGTVALIGYDLERPELHIVLDDGFLELATDQTLGVVDGVIGIHGRLIFRRIPDEPLRAIESHVGRRRPIALIVRDDFHATILPHTDSGIRRTEIESDGDHCMCF